MPAERFFKEGIFHPKQEITLEGQELHHLARVMRVQVGEAIELVNGKRQLAHARLTALAKERATLEILSIEEAQLAPKEVILVQALPLFNRLEYILEKGTELGAAAFWLFPGVFSEKKELSANQEQRLNTLLLSALKQCGRLDLPTFSLKPPLAKWETPSGTLLFGDTRPEAQPLIQLALSTAKSPIFLFIGPEKGFHSSEVTLLDHWGAKGVKLNSNILRVDTAALTALALANQLLA